MNSTRVTVRGSHKAPLKGAQFSGKLNPEEELEVTVRVRGRQPWAGTPECAALGTLPPSRRHYLTRAEFAARYGMRRWTSYAFATTRESSVPFSLSDIDGELSRRGLGLIEVSSNLPEILNLARQTSINALVIDFKDDSRHDPMLNDDLIIALKLATPAELRAIKKIALEINRLLSALLAKQGIVLVDFKIEFGRQGRSIRLGDEISMDSMRLWDTKTKESLDKDVYRFNKGDVMATYNQVSQRITQAPHPAKKKPAAVQKRGRGSPGPAAKPKAIKR